MKPVDVFTEIDIDRPVEAVAAFATDPENAPTWYDNIDSVEWRTEPPLRVGTVVSFVARFLGRRLAYDYEIVEHEPSVRLVMHTQQGPFPMETSYTWERRTAGTHMTLRNRAGAWSEVDGRVFLDTPYPCTNGRRRTDHLDRPTGHAPIR